MSKLQSPTREERNLAALSGTPPAPEPMGAASELVAAGGAARAKPPTKAPRAELASQPAAARKP